jgi:hypothetical protein
MAQHLLRSTPMRRQNTGTEITRGPLSARGKPFKMRAVERRGARWARETEFGCGALDCRPEMPGRDRKIQLKRCHGSKRLEHLPAVSSTRCRVLAIIATDLEGLFRFEHDAEGIAAIALLRAPAHRGFDVS